MTVIKIDDRKVLLALAGFVALIGAAILMIVALLLTVPLMAEPGSASWGARNRPQAILALLGGVALLIVAARCLGKSMSWRAWAVVAALVAVAALVKMLR